MEESSDQKILIKQFPYIQSISDLQEFLQDDRKIDFISLYQEVEEAWRKQQYFEFINADWGRALAVCMTKVQSIIDCSELNKNGQALISTLLNLKSQIYHLRALMGMREWCLTLPNSDTLDLVKPLDKLSKDIESLYELAKQLYNAIKLKDIKQPEEYNDVKATSYLILKLDPLIPRMNDLEFDKASNMTIPLDEFDDRTISTIKGIIKKVVTSYFTIPTVERISDSTGSETYWLNFTKNEINNILEKPTTAQFYDRRKDFLKKFNRNYAKLDSTIKLDKARPTDTVAHLLEIYDLCDTTEKNYIKMFGKKSRNIYDNQKKMFDKIKNWINENTNHNIEKMDEETIIKKCRDYIKITASAVEKKKCIIS